MAAIETSNFFKMERKASEIRSELLGPFFEAWCGIVLPSQKSKSTDTMLYMDLQAGEGYTEEDEPAMAVKILRSLYKSTGSRLDLNKAVKAFFSDPDSAAATRLKHNIECLPFYDELVHPPVVLQEETDQEVLKQLLEEGHPAFTYMEPFGSSFSQEMLLHSVKQGADLCMLFEPDQIRSAVKNSKADSPMQEVLGERLAQIKAYTKESRVSAKREEFLLTNFEDIFRDRGYNTFTFRINFPDKKQASHYLVFASKMDLAYIRIKELMLKYTDYQEDGVPLFGANLQHQQMALFQEHYKYSIESLLKDLSQKSHLYHNTALQQVYEKHALNTHYMMENYKLAYERLMKLGKVRFYNPKTGQTVNKLTYTSLIRYTG